METLIVDSWSINNMWYFILLAAALSLAVRVLSALLRAMETTEQLAEYVTEWWKAFRGFDSDQMVGDRWFPYILGFLEFLIYPFLMSGGLWFAIGAWITLKTIAQWKVWEEKRSVFNRFLIGNALVVILAFIVLLPMVTLTLKNCS